MLRRRVAVVLSVASVLCAAGVQGQPARENPAAGAEVMAKAATAMGGAQALAAIKDVTVRGTVRLTGPSGDLQGESVGEILFPDQMRSTVTLPMGVMNQGFDGRAGWSTLGGQTVDMPATLAVEMRRGIATAAGIGVVRDALDGRATVEAQPRAQVEGRSCDVVRWSKDQADATLFYDAETHLIAKIAYRADTPRGEMDLEIYLSDHKAVAGITVPFRVVGVQGGQRYLDMTVREVASTPACSRAIFAKPSP
jgi:hypothetical protein